jgi:hypothetical protein
MQNICPLSRDSFDITPSPHRRINRPCSLLAFAHIHGEAETPAEGFFWSAVVGRHGPFLCAEQGVNFTMQNVPFLETHSTPPRLRTGESTDLVRFWPSPTSMARRKRQRRASGARWWVGTVRFYVRNKRGEYPYAKCPLSRDSFDITPSPHRRINRPCSLLAFANIHGEAETPTEGFWSAVVGRHGPFLCAEQGVNFLMQNVPFLETHSTSPRLRTGESTDLVRFWPSPTSMARRKRQRRASSGARWWVGTVRFYVRNKG